MAASLAAKIRAAVNVEATLIAGSGGEFEVVVDATLVYSKRSTGVFPVEAELVEKIGRLR